jgi:hypothetical protein
MAPDDVILDEKSATEASASSTKKAVEIDERDLFLKLRARQAQTVPGLMARLEKLPNRWHDHVLMAFQYETRLHCFPSLESFYVTVSHRHLLHNLIEEVEIAYEL